MRRTRTDLFTLTVYPSAEVQRATLMHAYVQVFPLLKLSCGPKATIK